MELALRDYSPSDFEILYEIDQACYPRGIAYSRRTLGWFLDQRGSFCIVAQAKGVAETAILGFLIAQRRGNKGYIVTIDVLGSHRRSGVGTALLQETERRLAEMGVRHIELQTATNNQAGVAFWLRHGYRSSGVTRGYYLGRIDAHDMFKELHQPERRASG